jgi:hypothetical protein
LLGIFSLYFQNFNFLQNRDEKWVYLLNYKKNLCAFARNGLRGASFSQRRIGAKFAKIFLEARHGLTNYKWSINCARPDVDHIRNAFVQGLNPSLVLSLRSDAAAKTQRQPSYKECERRHARDHERHTQICCG